MGKFKDITGKKYGRLTAIAPTDKRKQGSVVWKCQCECGNEKEVARSHLEQGYTLSCGCLHSENVSKRIKLIRTKDITGQKFGRLTAVNPTAKRDNGFVIWNCKCDCGKENVYVNIHNLTSGNTLSCGCLNSELSKIKAIVNLPKHKEKTYIAGTRLDFIKSNKLNKNNTTGYKGVYLRKKDGKFFAHIEFQGKRHFLGSYDTKEDAAKVRKEAENRLYGDFFEWYKTSIKGNRNNL